MVAVTIADGFFKQIRVAVEKVEKRWRNDTFVEKKFLVKIHDTRFGELKIQIRGLAIQKTKC